MFWFLARCLQDKWCVLDRWVREQLLERIDTDFAIAKILMTILERTKDIHGVIGMDELDSLDSHDLYQEIQSGFHATFALDVMASCEDVTGVETDPHLRMMLECIEIGVEILEALDQRLTLTGRWFKQEPRIIVFEALEYWQHPLRDLSPCRFDE